MTSFFGLVESEQLTTFPEVQKHLSGSLQEIPFRRLSSSKTSIRKLNNYSQLSLLDSAKMMILVVFSRNMASLTKF